MDAPVLGQLCGPDPKRDAVHVAIMPMVASRLLTSGERLKNGIVDPYLTEPVQPGQVFYLCLYPNSVTSLRHVWTHVAFKDEASE